MELEFQGKTPEERLHHGVRAWWLVKMCTRHDANDEQQLETTAIINHMFPVSTLSHCHAVC